MELFKTDKENFNTLFREMYPRLVGYAFRFTKEKASAADIVQDSFVKLWQQRNRINIEHSLNAYLFRTVRNLSLNHIRDNAYEQPGLDPSMIEDMAQGKEAEQVNDMNVRRMKLLKKWIGQLPERQREAFELSRFDGLDHDEIAEVMNVSKRTVNNHIVDALRNIKKYQEEDHNSAGL